MSSDDVDQSTLEKVPTSADEKSWLRPLRSKFSLSDANDLPPDGGLRAWIQVVLAHLTVFNSFGYINSFGIFQAYYVTSLGVSPSAVSWVGSLEIFLVYFVGTFSGRAVDAGYFHLTIGLGFLLQVLGCFMTSISTEYYQLFLAQGICQGLGNGLLFCPVVTLVSTYFSKKRALALAFVACGGATGGLVFPSIAQSLLFKIGFSWTVRIMGFVILFNAVLVWTFTKVRMAPRSSGPLIEWSALKEVPYVLYSIGVFFSLWGIFYAYYYVRPFARDILGVSEYTSFNILLTINGVGFPGRVLPALISLWYLGPVNTIIPTILFGSIMLYGWIGVHDLGGMYAFVSLFGLPGGGVQSLFPAGVSSFTKDMNTLGSRIGMVFSIASPACLSGPPIAGALVEKMNGGYLGAQLFGGTVMFIGFLFMIAARIAQTGWNWKTRL